MSNILFAFYNNCLGENNLNTIFNLFEKLADLPDKLCFTINL